MKIIKIISILAGILFTFNAPAQWIVKSHVDSITDQTRKIAVINNSEGHTFSIYRISDNGAVWGNFAISDSSLDQVEWGKPPIYRVDKNKPNDLATLKSLAEVNINAYEWKPKWVNFVIWHGKQNEGMGTNLISIMNGKTILFRYHLFTGGYKDTSFSLKGAGPVIASAIGVSQKFDSEKEKSIDEFKTAQGDAVVNCANDMSKVKECTDKALACGKKANFNASAFHGCMK